MTAAQGWPRRRAARSSSVRPLMKRRSGPILRTVLGGEQGHEPGRQACSTDARGDILTGSGIHNTEHTTPLTSMNGIKEGSDCCIMTRNEASTEVRVTAAPNHVTSTIPSAAKVMSRSRRGSANSANSQLDYLSIEFASKRRPVAKCCCAL